MGDLIAEKVEIRLTRVQLYDTTLRDGAQSEGISFSVVDKLNIARKLDELGIHYIEGGWPGSNPKDVEFFDKARGPEAGQRHARRLRQHPPRRHQGRRGRQPAALVDAGAKVATIVGKSSEPAGRRRCWRPPSKRT